jgi:hypothetical protein
VVVSRSSDRLPVLSAGARAPGLISGAPLEMEEGMKENNEAPNNRGWLFSVLTDIHFWVPLVVLIGGLLLLRSIH